MKERIEGWLCGTYRIFQRPKGLFKLFQQFKPTDEAYVNAVHLFRLYLSRTDKSTAAGYIFDPNSTDYYEQATY